MNRLTLVLLLTAVALTQLPVLPLGYGVDPDAWRVASSAFHLWTTGGYEVSRYPGYPLHEIVSAPTVALGGPVASNGATLLVGLLLLIVWNRIASRETRHPALMVITLAFTPLFLKNSAVTMDYVWSLFFILLAMDRALQKKALLAGIFIGLAAGFRMSNLVAFVPVSVLLLDLIHPRWRQVVLFIVAAVLVTAVSYLPVILTVGMGRWYAETAAQLSSIRQHSELSVRMFLYRSVYAFGPLAVIAGIFLLGTKWRSIMQSLRSCDPLIWSAFAAIVVYGLMFFSLPLEREYLLPVAPFALLLLDRFLTRTHLLIFLLCVISYAFINPDIVSHQKPVGHVHPNVREGILPEECGKRSAIEATRHRILGMAAPERTIVVTDFPEPYWFNEEGVERIDSPFHEQLFRNRGTTHLSHIFSLSPQETRLARSLGFSVISLDEHTGVTHD